MFVERRYTSVQKQFKVCVHDRLFVVTVQCICQCVFASAYVRVKTFDP